MSKAFGNNAHLSLGEFSMNATFQLISAPSRHSPSFLSTFQLNGWFAKNKFPEMIFRKSNYFPIFPLGAETTRRQIRLEFIDLRKKDRKNEKTWFYLFPFPTESCSARFNSFSGFYFFIQSVEECFHFLSFLSLSCLSLSLSLTLSLSLSPVSLSCLSLSLSLSLSRLSRENKILSSFVFFIWPQTVSTEAYFCPRRPVLDNSF